MNRIWVDYDYRWGTHSDNVTTRAMWGEDGAVFQIGTVVDTYDDYDNHCEGVVTFTDGNRIIIKLSMESFLAVGPDGYRQYDLVAAAAMMWNQHAQMKSWDQLNNLEKTQLTFEARMIIDAARGIEETYTTKTGKVLTDADIEKFAEEDATPGSPFAPPDPGYQ